MIKSAAKERRMVSNKRIKENTKERIKKEDMIKIRKKKRK